MRQFNILLKKELRDSWRSFKFIWIPLVFLMLGVSDPLVNYFMDDIMTSVGNMPDGFSITMPEMFAPDLLLASTGQFQMIGVIVLIAAYIGTFSRERANGTATLLYVRPIAFTALFFSKWAVASLVAVISALAGYAGSMYYTAILYGTVEVGSFLAMCGTYCMWLLLVMAITVAMSAALKTSIAAALAIVLIPLGSIIDGLIGSFWTVTPWKLAGYGIALLTDSVDLADYWWTLGVTVTFMVAFMIFGIVMSKKQASSVKV